MGKSKLLCLNECDGCRWGLFRPEHSGGICRNRSLCLRTMPVSLAYARPLVWMTRECEFLIGGALVHRVKWGRGRFFYSSWGFFPGGIKVYKKPSHSQTWSSRVAKVTATRIKYIHTYILSLSRFKPILQRWRICVLFSICVSIA